MPFAKKQLKQEKLACKTPWIFEGINNEQRECNETEHDLVFENIAKLYKRYVTNSIPGCFWSCSAIRYQSRLRFYKPIDGLLYYENLKDIVGHQVIYIYFYKDEATVEDYIPTLSTWGLISACGGSLGLFLGFSCYGLALSSIDLLKQRAL